MKCIIGKESSSTDGDVPTELDNVAMWNKPKRHLFAHATLTFAINNGTALEFHQPTKMLAKALVKRTTRSHRWKFQLLQRLPGLQHLQQQQQHLWNCFEFCGTPVTWMFTEKTTNKNTKMNIMTSQAVKFRATKQTNKQTKKLLFI